MNEEKVIKIGNYSPSGHNAASIIDVGGLAPTVMGNHGTVTAVNAPNNKYAIRKLTPKECYRLMGFDDIDYERASEVLSDSWIYHTAGDSIVVNVLEEIFKELL